MRWDPHITRHLVALFLILPVLCRCAKAKEEPRAKQPHERESSSPSAGVTGAAENQAAAPLATLPDQKSSDAMEMPNSASRSAVLIGGDRGVTVSGEGADTPPRFSAELEQQLLTFLPQLREVYDQELTRDPHGMGSLDVKMTIEPNGSVSELRFPLKRVSSDHLTTAVYDVMRAWQFAPAEGPVDVRYRLLLVPPGMDPASIEQWEQHLANRMERDGSEKRPMPVASTASDKPPIPPAIRATKKSEEPTSPGQPQRSVASETGGKEGRPGAGFSRQRASQREAGGPPSFSAQWYQVTRPTALYVSPHSSAPIVARFHPGKHVWVIGIVDRQWLEIRSVKGRQPGFLPREDAEPDQRRRARHS